MRVQSNQPCKNGGWLHKMEETEVRRHREIKPEKVTEIDAGKLMNDFYENTWAEMVSDFAVFLGVKESALESIGCAWATGYNAWAFPMRDWCGKIVGIRLRNYNGHKWAVRGSKAGLFYSDVAMKQPFIVEGPTDVAAALSIGLEVIGRPSCIGNEVDIVKLIQRKHCERVVVIADNDVAGTKGTSRLATMLKVPFCVTTLPAKDMRSYVRAGGTIGLINAIIDTLVWRQPK